MQNSPLRVGLAGLGAVGGEVARRLEADIPGLVLTAVAVRDIDKARRKLPRIGGSIAVLPPEAMACAWGETRSGRSSPGSDASGIASSGRQRRSG